jgi:hypothetical protein
MKYHSLKMEEVNDTMRHLWNKTYQGTGTHRSYFGRYTLKSTVFEDIDGIRIRYDGEGGASKRSYNYRVRILRDSSRAFRQHSSNTMDTRAFLGRNDKRSGGNGHARTVFRRTENAGIYHHSACPFRFFRAKLWHISA